MKRWEDVVIFGKIISVGLLIGGYVFFGVLIARKLAGLGFPPWVIVAIPLLGALFGLQQGWFMVRGIIRKGRRK